MPIINAVYAPYLYLDVCFVGINHIVIIAKQAIIRKMMYASNVQIFKDVPYAQVQIIVHSVNLAIMLTMANV